MMKKTVLAIIVAGFVVTQLTGFAQALTIDTFKGATHLANSGEGTELAWVNEQLGGGYTFLYKDEELSGEWTDVGGGIYSHALVDSPAYFLIKTGNIADSSNTHFLFQNIGELNLAVIKLGENGLNFTDIDKISYISTFDGNAPIPEPATMLLFGTGLAGLVGVARKRKNKA